MSTDMLIVCAILVVTAVMLATEALRIDVVAILCMLALGWTGLLEPQEMLSNEGAYDGVAAYAMTKRGQVVLSEMLAQDLADIGATVNAMHPGWSATKGVEHSLPRFWNLMRNRLRTPAEGADTPTTRLASQKTTDNAALDERKEHGRGA